MDFQKHNMMLKCVLVLVGVTYIEAYSKGAPSTSCETMIPGHRSSSPRTDASPYTITAPIVKCKKDITVTVSGSESFMGFFCQPRPDVNVAKTMGTFTPLGNTSLVQDNCNQLTSLTHTSKELKSSVQFTWIPEGDETVYIVCTFVKQYNTFWVKQSSSAIKLNLDDPLCSSASPNLPSVPYWITTLAAWFLRRVLMW